MTLPVFLTRQPLADLLAIPLDAPLAAPLAQPGTSPNPVITVGAEVAAHAVKVRRLGVGDRLQLIDGTGTRVTGMIREASNDLVVLTVETCAVDPEPVPTLTLVQALAKGERDLAAIEAATEVGVDRVIPWQAQRSVVTWPAKKADKMAAKWHNTLTAATLQSRRSRIPRLEPLVRGTDVAAVVSAGSRVIVLDESATTGLATALGELGQVRDVAVVVGPEGGISNAEVEALCSAGALPAVLGSTILRASTAGPVALGIVQTLVGRWA